MNLFDTEIKDIKELINNYSIKQLPITDKLLEDLGKNNMIFSNETKYELGIDSDSLSYDLSTSNNELINEDKILLIGKDLNEITSDNKFSRITLVNIKDDPINSNELYDRLEKIKLTKYRVSPKGYMLRTASGDREKIRVAKDFNSNFSTIGSMYLKAYKLIPYVNNVTIIFITEDNKELFESIKKIANKKNNIMDTIDHILKGMIINDCDACSVKELCDEVQGLREIHQNIEK